VTRGRRRALVALLLAAALGVAAYLRPVAVLQGAGELWLRLSGVHSRHAQAGPYRLRYLEAGSGPPLLLVHGLGSNALQDWGALVAPLARRYHVYAPDLPGFGRSERPPNAEYSIPMQAEAVRAFLEAVRVSRARVAGLSMGGWIVARLAGEHPELVERLVLVAPAGLRPEDGAPIPVEVLFPRDEAGVRRMIAAIRHKPPRVPAFLARDILAVRLRDEWIVRRALESMRPGKDWVNGTLARADMPVLILWGKQDALIPVAYAPRFAAQLAHAKLQVLDGCGHVPMADCPQEFEAVMTQFLADSRP
jgi:pimeloyl-ACP methyl ester carboxylesterase